MIAIILNSALFVMTLYDTLFARRDGGDPTKMSKPIEPTTYGNPGFRERRAPTNGKARQSLCPFVAFTLYLPGLLFSF